MYCIICRIAVIIIFITVTMNIIIDNSIISKIIIMLSIIVYLVILMTYNFNISSININV